ncbi:molybdenum-pterin binding domain protein [Mycobacterium xenopi 4042]|nr:molybdenum-pterin binding domain protein [Mycobacterium xenopi 4042]
MITTGGANRRNGTRFGPKWEPQRLFADFDRSARRWAGKRQHQLARGPMLVAKLPVIRRTAMRLSTRNQLKGTIAEVALGNVMAIVKVRLDGGDQVITSSITKDAAQELGLKAGQPATVFIKSTEVTIGVD